MIREVLAGTALWVWILIVVVLAGAAIAVLGAETEGWFISKHTQNIRHSIGYVDAQNSLCREDMREYDAAATDAAKNTGVPEVVKADASHEASLLNDCRGTISQLQPSEIASDVSSWLAQHQGG